MSVFDLAIWTSIHFWDLYIIIYNKIMSCAFGHRSVFAIDMFSTLRFWTLIRFCDRCLAITVIDPFLPSIHFVIDLYFVVFCFFKVGRPWISTPCEFIIYYRLLITNKRFVIVFCYECKSLSKKIYLYRITFRCEKPF